MPMARVPSSLVRVYLCNHYCALGPKLKSPSATRHAAVARRTGETGRWDSRDALRTPGVLG
eukprot:1907925-Prymnesium_polylepis.1